MKIVWNKTKAFLKRIVLLNDTPHGIALGFAVGLFLSVVPTFGVGMVVALALAPLIRGNLVSTYLGTLVVNPVTGAFFYSLNYLIGCKLLGMEFGAGVVFPKHLFQLPELVESVAGPLYLGGFILALVLSLLAYAAVFKGTKIYQEEKRTEGGI